MTPRDFKTEGIILSKRRQGETDYFVNILSPEFGKLTVIAKGALKINSQFLGKLEIGQRLFFTIHTTSFNYLMIKECDVISNQSVESYETLTHISQILEMLKKIEFVPQFNEPLFILLAKSLLITVDKGKPAIIYMKTIILNVLGYLPDFSHCSLCNESSLNKEVHYSEVGEIHCKRCNDKKYHELLSFNQLKLLKYLKSINWNIEKTLPLNIETHDLQGVERYIDSIICHAMNINLIVH